MKIRGEMWIVGGTRKGVKTRVKMKVVDKEISYQLDFKTSKLWTGIIINKHI